MRGNPHSYQSIAHEDPGYWPSECEICHDAEAVEHDSSSGQEICSSCMDDLEAEYFGDSKEDG